MPGLRELMIATRPWSFTMTAVSVTGAASYSYYSTGAFDPLLYLLTLAGVTLLHAAANVLNDYYDTIRGVDVEGAPTTRYRPHPIISGMMIPKYLRNYGFSLMFAGLCFAVALSLIRPLVPMLLALVGALLLLTYSGPLGYKYRAMGELGVFLAWGVFIWVGTHYVLTGSLSLGPAIAGAPVGLLVAAVLTANNLRDVEYDGERGAKTMIVMMGVRRGIMLYAAEVLIPYALVLTAILAGSLPLTSLLTLLTLPMALRILRRFSKAIPENSDPMTASLVQNFGILYIVGMLLGVLVGR
ncbi:MAG: prenyltransferase [Candidatus Korarchaeota archaeon NZ13-K]|nr:MAG: prenyltransferase [Candidatus Korarchaeota archaeon NZ13-K]